MYKLHTGAFVGNFGWAAGEKLTLISNEAGLVEVFFENPSTQYNRLSLRLLFKILLHYK